jgi:putative transposase
LHTDQGSEYTAHWFRTACQRMGIRQSMGRAPDRRWTIESWHSTLEFELRSLRRFATSAEARTAVAAWIDDYNRYRRRSALQMKSPVDFELGQQAA